jgi:predicted outer membrane repeat protein
VTGQADLAGGEENIGTPPPTTDEIVAGIHAVCPTEIVACHSECMRELDTSFRVASLVGAGKFIRDQTFEFMAVWLCMSSPPSGAVVDTVTQSCSVWLGFGHDTLDHGACHVGPTAQLDVLGSAFVGNYASGTAAYQQPCDTTICGGAIFLDARSTLRVQDSVFVGNSASSYGGAIHAGSLVLLDIQGSTFAANSAYNLENYGDGGGAILVEIGGQLRVHGSTFAGNAATGTSCGAIFVGPAAQGDISGSTFAGNSAMLDGGAICAYANAKLHIRGSSFTANNAPRRGGAIFIGSDGLLSIHRSSLTQHVAPTGGAIYAESSAQLDIRDSVLQANFAGNGAGFAGNGAHIKATSPDRFYIYNTTLEPFTPVLDNPIASVPGPANLHGITHFILFDEDLIF